MTKDGTKFIFNREELHKVASVLPEEFYTQFKLPFLFIRRTDLGKSIFHLNGGKLENFIARKLIDLIEGPINRYKINNADLPQYFYWTDIRAFRKKFKTLFAIGFSVSTSTI
jgi:uncharacterized protein (UPF0216 family)